MSIPFAQFDQTSQMSTSPHDPMLSLASNCIRDFFGPTVQLVADGLWFRGEPSTLTQLVSTLRKKCGQKVYSQERIRLLGKSVASRLQNQNLQLPNIKASLLVLVEMNEEIPCTNWEQCRLECLLRLVSVQGTFVLIDTVDGRHPNGVTNVPHNLLADVRFGRSPVRTYE